jgi:peptidoglycan hydrolase-like protein with peptidoglycan-binding domain
LLLAVLTACGFRAPPPAPPQPEATAPPVTILPETPLTPDQIALVQSMLTKRGYKPGPADGKMGPNTSRAISRYQRENRLQVDGAATASLIHHMKGQPEIAPQVIAVETAIPSDLYPVGTRFVYSGIELHTVTGVKGARISWKTNHGDRYVTGAHFGLPALEWQTGTWKGTAVSTLPPESSWPPNQGMDVYFDVTSQEWNAAQGKNAQRHVSDVSWSCSNKGVSAVKVPAGSFTTQAIVCVRSPAPTGAWQKRVWYYLPAAGQFARRDDFDDTGLEIAKTELVAILPGVSEKIRKSRDNAIHDALDSASPGEITVWRSPDGAERYVIRVNSGFYGPGGKQCRTYSITKQGSLPRREYPAVACKGDRKKRWVTPGLE